MDQKPLPPLNTKEFVAHWHNIVEGHLVANLADALGRLAASAPEESGLTSGQSAVLAHHVAHALMVAASSTGGVEPAVDYLQQAASAH